jgi:DNA-binding CsgD family transcriptional regulator
MAERLGDLAWSEVKDAHDSLIQAHLARYRGREVKKTISGFLATFDGPARAIRCASAIVEAAHGMGIIMRAGLHAGECEIVGDDIRGIALQIAERVYDRAAPGDVVVSSTVKDLVAGAGLGFEELEPQLRTGPAASWRLHRVVAGPQRSPAVSPRPAGALSPREREIAILITRGHSNRQIADQLAIAPATVDRHVTNILRKMEFRSRAQVAAWVVMHGLFSGDESYTDSET